MSALYIRDADGKFIQIKTIKGDKGDTPEKGVDYFTDEDIGDIVNAVYAKVANGNEVAY